MATQVPEHKRVLREARRLSGSAPRLELGAPDASARGAASRGVEEAHVGVRGIVHHFRLMRGPARHTDHVRGNLQFHECVVAWRRRRWIAVTPGEMWKVSSGKTRMLRDRRPHAAASPRSAPHRPRALVILQGTGCARRAEIAAAATAPSGNRPAAEDIRESVFQGAESSNAFDLRHDSMLHGSAPSRGQTAAVAWRPGESCQHLNASLPFSSRHPVG